MSLLPTARTTLAVAAITLALGACGDSTNRAGDTGATDDFLREAFDAYGVIDVARVGPVARAPEPRSNPGPPMQTAASGMRKEADGAKPQLSLRQVCEGKSGVQNGYIVQSTGKPLDCGPAPVSL